MLPVTESAAQTAPLASTIRTGFLQNLAGRPNLIAGRAPNAFEGLATQ